MILLLKSFIDSELGVGELLGDRGVIDLIDGRVGLGDHVNHLHFVVGWLLLLLHGHLLLLGGVVSEVVDNGGVEEELVAVLVRVSEHRPVDLDLGPVLQLLLFICRVVYVEVSVEEACVSVHLSVDLINLSLETLDHPKHLTERSTDGSIFTSNLSLRGTEESVDSTESTQSKRNLRPAARQREIGKSGNRIKKISEPGNTRQTRYTAPDYEYNRSVPGLNTIYTVISNWFYQLNLVR